MMSRSGRLGAILTLVILGLALAVFLTKWLFPGSSLQIAQLRSSFNLDGYFKFDFESQKIKQIVASGLEGADGEFGVVVEDLGGKERYSLNGEESFPTASLYKLILMAAVLKEVENNQLDLTDHMSAKQSYLSKTLGSNDFGYDPATETISMTIEQALDRIARVSDNYAAIMLTDKLRDRAKLKAMADQLGMLNTDFDSELIMSTPSDIALFFKKLYSGQVVSKGVSESITNLLLKAQLNNRIPALLPKQVQVAHKTGELPGIKHDAGIVFIDPIDVEVDATTSGVLTKRAYLIVLMSKDIKSEDQVVKAYAKLSKDIYDYLSTKK